MELSCKPRQTPDFRLEQLDGELLLYHPGQTTIMYCNPTASLIWGLCDGQRSVQGIIALLSAAYEQAAAAVAADVKATLEQFHQHGAIGYVGEDGQVVKKKSG
jgi:Coenzyme PQQ synthesis protein D (PqqD)